MLVVIHCAECDQKYRVPKDQLGTRIKCQKCDQVFTAVEAVSEIPPEFDESIPAKKPIVESHKKEPRIEPRSSGGVKPAEVQGVPWIGRLLFWGGAALIMLAINLNTSIKTDDGRMMHNLARATNQLLLLLSGMASMISGAVFAARRGEMHLIEGVLIVLWMIAIGVVLALPLM